MRSSYQVNIILMIELVNNISTKQVPGATRADAPPTDIVGVAPHEVAHSAVVRDFLLAVEATDLI